VPQWKIHISSIIGYLCGHYECWRGQDRRGDHWVYGFRVGVQECIMAKTRFNFILITKASEEAKIS
jgi:hypothetical protein